MSVLFIKNSPETAPSSPLPDLIPQQSRRFPAFLTKGGSGKKSSESFLYWTPDLYLGMGAIWTCIW